MKECSFCHRALRIGETCTCKGAKMKPSTLWQKLKEMGRRIAKALETNDASDTTAVVVYIIGVYAVIGIIIFLLTLIF